MTLDRRALLTSGGAAAALAAFPAAARQAAPAAHPAARALDGLAEEWLRLNPTSATSLGIDTGARAALRSRLATPGAAGVAEQSAWVDGALARLARLDLTDADEQTRLSAACAKAAWTSAQRGFRFGYGDVAVGGWRNGPYVVAQNMGSYLDTPKFLDASHRIASAADAEAYLARLGGMAAQLDGETAQLRDARGRGVIASDVLLDKTLAGLRLARQGDPSSWLVVTSLTTRARQYPGDWSARATRIAAQQIAPALDRQIAELEQHRRAATSDAGVWRFRDGADYYAWALAAATTTSLTPDQVHERGREELTRLQAEMDTILKAEGYTQGTVGARMAALARDPRYKFAEGDPGRAQIMALIQDRLADIRTRLPRGFSNPSRGNVEVKRIAAAEEIGAPGAYGGAGTIDGSVPGRFWINLRTTDLHNRFSLPTLTYHESLPGHVWQGEYAQRLPLIRMLMGFSAYGEGWGLYAEQLAGELGVYEGNPVGRLGYLQSIAFRACRLVVDTGLHHKRWTRDQAIRWFAETNGSGIEEVTSEVDRYCAWPGQACGYKLGHSEINRLRDRARAALGARYDLRAFNDTVIGTGAVPLSVLGEVVDRWAAARRA